MTTTEVRFWRFVTKGAADECWLWTGCTNGRYPQFSDNGNGRKHIYAHRWSYEHHRGPIPTGLTIDHLCRTPLCVNPSHLEAVTQRVNNLRSTNFAAIHAAATHCINGHELTPENTYHRPDRPQGRGRCCRECRSERDRNRQPRPKKSA
jgi:hypothetical protein